MIVFYKALIAFSFLLCGFSTHSPTSRDAKVGESEPLPVAFRYNVRPVASMRTNVFRPNPLPADVKFNNLGALWIGKWDQLPESKIVDVLWEAGDLMFTANYCVLVVLHHLRKGPV